MPDSLPQVAQSVTPISAAPGTPSLPAESPEIPSMFQDLRVKVSNLATKAGNMLDTAGKVADKVVPGMHQVEELGKTPVGQKVQHDVMNDLTETVTNPEKRLNFLMGAVQPGGEADPFEGLRVKPSDIYTKEGGQALVDHINIHAPESKAKIVGSVADKGKSLHDLDLRLEGKYDQSKIEAAMKAKGFEPMGSSVVSPEEAQKSGKDFGNGWARAHHFEKVPENAAPETTYRDRRKVDIWHNEPNESAKQTNWEQVLRDSGLGMNAGKVKTENVGTPTSAQEVLKDMVRSYGANSDVQGVKNGASFITKDGKFVYLPADHPQTLFKHGYDAKSDDDRVPFVNESGAVRTNFRKGSDSDTLAVSVPNKKVTPEQVESIRRAVGAVRNGTLLLETADKPSSIRSQVKQFASVRDVDGMLKSLGVHPEQAKAEKFDSTGTSTVESNPESRWSYKNKPTGAAVDKFTKQNKEILKNKDLSVGYVKESEGRPYKLTVRKADLGSPRK